MNLFFKKSVKAKVIINITLLIGVIALSVFLYFPNQYRSVKMGAINDKISTISKIASFNVGSGLYFNDPDAVEEQLESILKIPDICYIIVKDQKDFGGFRNGVRNTKTWLYIKLITLIGSCQTFPVIAINISLPYLSAI